MKRRLIVMTEFMKILLAGKTEAGSAEAQPAGDSQLKAMNCHLAGSYTPAALFSVPRQFRALLCLKKPDIIAPPKAVSISAEGTKKSLNRETDLSNSR